MNCDARRCNKKDKYILCETKRFSFFFHFSFGLFCVFVPADKVYTLSFVIQYFISQIGVYRGKSCTTGDWIYIYMYIYTKYKSMLIYQHTSKYYTHRFTIIHQHHKSQGKEGINP